MLVDSAESCRVFSFHRVLFLMPHIQPRCCIHTDDALASRSSNQRQQPSLEMILLMDSLSLNGLLVRWHVYTKLSAGPMPVNHLVIELASPVNNTPTYVNPATVRASVITDKTALNPFSAMTWPTTMCRRKNAPCYLRSFIMADDDNDISLCL